MGKQQRDATAKAGVPSLKTCQTCFNAKIRCDRTQDSGLCDRCMRLNKPCVFAPARRRNAAPHKSRIDQLEAKLDRVIGSRQPSPGREGSARAGSSAGDIVVTGSDVSDAGTTGLPLQLAASVDSCDPLTCGLLDLDRSERLLDLFRFRMASRFPFVVLPEAVTVHDLRRERPYLYLAVMAVSAFEDFILQRKLSSLFNQVLATKMVRGKTLSVDVLQGLLLHLAWAHYQPRPRSYSQHLHLATSIVSDLRLDRPRKLQLWKVDFNDGKHSAEWGSDELRALIGTYYLASSSSLVLQKMRHFPYTHFILESCEKLELQGEFPSDKYLKHIVHLQRLSEEFDDVVAQATAKSSADEITAKVATIRQQVDSFKSNLTFALSQCPTLQMQLGILELFISQQSLPGFPLASSSFQHTLGSNLQIVDSFAESVAASKSLINILLAMPPGQENILSNLEWIILSCGLSFSARFDVLAAAPRISHLTQHLRRSLGIRHTLRQVILRLESIVSLDEDSVGDRDTFYHFLQRAQAIEAWHLRQTEHSSLSTPTSINVTPSDGDDATQGMGKITSMTELIAAVPIGECSESGPGEFNGTSMPDFFTEDMQDTDFGLYLSSTNFDFF